MIECKMCRKYKMNPRRWKKAVDKCTICGKAIHRHVVAETCERNTCRQAWYVRQNAIKLLREAARSLDTTDIKEFGVRKIEKLGFKVIVHEVS